jgi:hypothetical protein
MTDMAFAHVFRPVRRNQSGIAPDARNFIRRILLVKMTTMIDLPVFYFASFLALER